MTWFERETTVVVEKGATAHELLKIIYQCPELPLTTRMRAAIAALPFETPKLAVTAQITEMNDFATLLDRRIQRYQEMKTIEHRPPQVEVKPPAAERMRRRI